MEHRSLCSSPVRRTGARKRRPRTRGISIWTHSPSMQAEMKIAAHRYLRTQGRFEVSKRIFVCPLQIYLFKYVLALHSQDVGKVRSCVCASASLSFIFHLRKRILTFIYLGTQYYSTCLFQPESDMAFSTAVACAFRCGHKSVPVYELASANGIDRVPSSSPCLCRDLLPPLRLDWSDKVSIPFECRPLPFDPNIYERSVLSCRHIQSPPKEAPDI